MHLPSLAQRLTSERNQAAAATHNNTHRFSRRTGSSTSEAATSGPTMPGARPRVRFYRRS